MKKHVKKLSMVLVLLLMFCTVVSVSAETIMTFIYVNQTYSQSQTKSFSGSVGLFGINDQASTNDLYYEVYEDTFGVDPCIYSALLSPGTGNMSSYSWYAISSGYNLGTTKDLYVYLDPAGLGGQYCYGAGAVAN